MYQYGEIDRSIVSKRAQQFRGQVERFLEGKIPADEFQQLRLRNGLYVERQAPMLRVAIPYGLLSSVQLRKLASISRHYDRGYGHFTTRQNIQYNWPAISRVPDLLGKLAEVNMHAIQTSGNVVRNITADHLAGVAPDEIADPRPYCELLRQWSTFHPEFNWLPRKFKIAITGARNDRAAIKWHDIGLRLVENEACEVGFEVYVGGGMGRTPVIGKRMCAFLPRRDLLSYVESILRVYNLHGRRDNPHKARIKILVKSLGIDAFTHQVEADWQESDRSRLTLDDDRIEAMCAHFESQPYRRLNAPFDPTLAPVTDRDSFERWYRQNTQPHRVSGYRIVGISLKRAGVPPGDLDADGMDVVAKLADRFSFGEVRVTHAQNLVLADVEQTDLPLLWDALHAADLGTPNLGTLNDMICCPGLDYCSLANATSLDVAAEINKRFADLDRLYDLGPIELKISGCMNACGHHHAGHIGILGVDKHGEQWYQLTLGGAAGNDAALGKRLGPALDKASVVDGVERILEVYLKDRLPSESFVETVGRIGVNPFKEHVYAR